MATTNKLFGLGSGNTGNLSVSSGSASATITSLVNKSEGTIRLTCDVDCFVRVTKAASTAVTTDLRLVAGAIEAFGVAGDSTTLSAITSGASGTLNYALDKGA